MDEKTTGRLTQALGVATGMHEDRRQELAKRLEAVSDGYDLHALDAAREAAYRYVVAASELRGFRWALRQALEEDEIAAMTEDAGSNWDELLTAPNPPSGSVNPQNEPEREG